MDLNTSYMLYLAQPWAEQNSKLSTKLHLTIEEQNQTLTPEVHLAPRENQRKSPDFALAKIGFET